MPSQEFSFEQLAERMSRPARLRAPTPADAAVSDIRNAVGWTPIEELLSHQRYSAGEAGFDAAWHSDSALLSFLSWANASQRRLKSIEWLSDGSFKMRYTAVYAGVPIERTAFLSDSHKNVNLGGAMGLASSMSVRRSLKSLFGREGIAPGGVLPAGRIPSFSHACMRRHVGRALALPRGVKTR